MQHGLLRLYRLCASFVPLVPVLYHFFCTKWYSLNVGISSKTICCTTCTTFFYLMRIENSPSPAFFYI